MHWWRGARQLFLYIGQAPALLDAPTGYRIEGWGANSFSTRQAEARMMPRTAHGVLDKKTVSKWSAVMRARRADCEHFIPASDKEHRFSVCVAEQHGPIGNIRNFNPLREIRSTEFWILLRHFDLDGPIEKAARVRAAASAHIRQPRAKHKARRDA
jgi:hypothetical protein